MASEAGRNRNVRQRDGQPDEMISLTSHIFPATDDDDGPSRQCVNSEHAADSATGMGEEDERDVQIRVCSTAYAAGGNWCRSVG